MPVGSSTPSGWNGPAGGAVSCTLLGPEGPGRKLCFRTDLLDSVCRRDFCAAECRPYLENYTVDASILDTGIRSGITKMVEI